MFAKGTRVTSKLNGMPARVGTIADPADAYPGRIYVRWDGNVLANGYPMESAVAESLKPLTVNATRVAQQISYEIEQGIQYPSNVEYADLTEVGAELQNSANGLSSQFTIKTLDGQEWTVRVTPAAG